MSLNIMNEFIHFKVDTISSYAAICLDKNYKKQTFSKLANTYVKIRYEDFDNELANTHSKNRIVSILNNHLISKAQKLNKTADNKSLKQMLYFFGFVYHLDNVLDNYSDNEIINKINDYRKNVLNLEPIAKDDILSIKKDHDKRLDTFISKFQDKYFELNLGNTTNKKVYNIKLNHYVPISKLYSNYAIQNVYNTGIVGENKLFIEYYQTGIKCLNDAINYDFNTSYLVEFNLDILKKVEKSKRLLNIIDNDIMKEKIVLKLSYSDFIKEKDKVTRLISNGYNFALIIDDTFKYLDSEIITLNMFKYVIGTHHSKEREIPNIIYLR